MIKSLSFTLKSTILYMGNVKPGILPKTFHTGKIVSDKAKEMNVSLGEIARRTKRAPVSIYRTLLAPNLSTSFLWEMGRVLQHDFFADISKEFLAVNVVSAKAPATSEEALKQVLETKEADIILMQKEIDRLTEERNYLKKIIDVLAAKL